MTQEVEAQSFEATEWSVPPDPDFEALAADGIRAFRAASPGVVAFDTETSGFEWDDEAFCVTAAWRAFPKMVTIGTGPGPKNVLADDGVVYTYSNYKRLKEQGRIESAYFELALYDASAEVREVLDVPSWVGHNLKFDLHRILNAGLITREQLANTRIHDTEAMAHLQDEHRRKGLKDLAVSVLGIEDTIQVPIKSKPGEYKEMPREKWELEQAKKWAKKEYGLNSVNEVGYDILPRGTVVPYALKDADFTYQLARSLYPHIKSYPELHALYEQEMALTRVFVDMEQAGLGVDLSYVSAQIKVLAKRLLDIEAQITLIVQKPVRTGKMTEKEKPQFFNPQSNDQIKKFFTSKGFQRPKYDADELETIDHPLAEAILDLRGTQKLLSNYFMALKKEMVNGVYHPSIRQHGTVTGRTSSGGAKGDA